jgi:integrase
LFDGAQYSSLEALLDDGLLMKLGVPPAATHAFRHGRISILQQNRVPGDLIKEWVGHTSLKITSKYAHFDDKYRQGIIKKLK